MVDSLRHCSLSSGSLGTVASTPFLNRLSGQTLYFRRAYATECWTLPTHTSIFTGLLPSEHNAHFQTMAYGGIQPTAAELLRSAGYKTEILTRNSIFDGSIPGVTRGFERNSVIVSDLRGLNPLSVFLAISKPRFRRQILTTGFFHPKQRASRRFVTRFARATVPADRQLLDAALERMSLYRAKSTPYFLVCNLYDVHAPYPPSERSIFRPTWSLRGLAELVLLPLVLPKLGGHAYLRAGFRMPSTGRQILLDRYHDAIGLMDDKLEKFYRDAAGAGLLDDTLLIVTSDHGEGFGEHGLYLHDASLYETHVHVPLYVHHPDGATGSIDDVVSTRNLFGLILGAPRGRNTRKTILDPAFRLENPIALAEHFHYPHISNAQPQYQHDIMAAIVGDEKVLVHPDGVRFYDLSRDPFERNPVSGTIEQFGDRCRRLGIDRGAIEKAAKHLQRWESRVSP